MDLRQRIKQRLNFIYKENYSAHVLEELLEVVDNTKAKIIADSEKWTEQDAVLITYGDSIIKDGEPPLKTLCKFVKEQFGDALSYVHILPFFPYSSDDGFSVIDYYKVNPELGDWDDVHELSKSYKLMFDLVINHISQHSEWYKEYLAGKSPGKDYFFEASPEDDLNEVVRPRSLPLLTKASTPEGEKYVWTTFSEDQIDLNFSNPDLLLEMVKIFLFYLEKGATMIRLDAIAFLWKEIGTNCLHLPQTHEFVKLLRDVADYMHPGFILLTETNVPNKENLSYFGENDEANMVYQFSLPPLLLNSLYFGDSEALTSWAKGIPDLPEECTFFNFTASHDGVGVRPLEGLLTKEESEMLVQGMREFGGKVNMRRNPDESESPYEINITYFDAMSGTREGLDEFQAERFVCSQTIMMTLAGVPAFYIHSLLGSHNYHEGVERTGMNRTINRRKWELGEIQGLLKGNNLHSKVKTELIDRINTRRCQPSFHPNAAQEIVDAGKEFFVVKRNDAQLTALFNLTKLPQKISIDKINLEYRSSFDILSGRLVKPHNGYISLKPYQSMWLIDSE